MPRALIDFILESGEHGALLAELTDNCSQDIRIASPFVTDRALLPRSRARHTRLITTLNPWDIACGSTRPDVLRELQNSGVDVRIYSKGRLHAKVYVFAAANAVITSANFTRAALSINLEAGVAITGTPCLMLAKWFDQIWDDSTPLGETALKDAEGKALRLKRRNPDAGRAQSSASSIDAGTRSTTRKAKIYICNTNLQASRGSECERKMLDKGYAAGWYNFSGRKTIEHVPVGSKVLMYSNRAKGFVGLGITTAPPEKLKLSNPNCLVGFGREPEHFERRVKLRWHALVEDRQRFSIDGVLGGQGTFFEVRSGKMAQRAAKAIRYLESRGVIRKVSPSRIAH
ncbi:MAG: phospholipase D family protein [Planctomycetes bacterium]|nr:phospholipase D family protein [Planctomycetota bacterium]